MLALVQFHLARLRFVRVFDDSLPARLRFVRVFDDSLPVNDQFSLVIGLNLEGVFVFLTEEYALPMRLEVVAADGRIRRVALPVEVDFVVVAHHLDGFHLIEFLVRPCAIDGFSVNIEPLTEVQQSFLLQQWDFAVGGRPYVERHATTSRH